MEIEKQYKKVVLLVSLVGCVQLQAASPDTCVQLQAASPDTAESQSLHQEVIPGLSGQLLAAHSQATECLLQMEEEGARQDQSIELILDSLAQAVKSFNVSVRELKGQMNTLNHGLSEVKQSNDQEDKTKLQVAELSKKIVDIQRQLDELKRGGCAGFGMSDEQEHDHQTGCCFCLAPADTFGSQSSIGSDLKAGLIASVIDSPTQDGFDNPAYRRQGSSMINSPEIQPLPTQAQSSRQLSPTQSQQQISGDAVVAAAAEPLNSQQPENTGSFFGCVSQGQLQSVLNEQLRILDWLKLLESKVSENQTKMQEEVLMIQTQETVFFRQEQQITQLQAALEQNELRDGTQPLQQVAAGNSRRRSFIRSVLGCCMGGQLEGDQSQTHTPHERGSLQNFSQERSSLKGLGTLARNASQESINKESNA